MSDLTSVEKLKLEKLFGMESGYVLGFSNRTFQDFILENARLDIRNAKYDHGSGSKANRLRAFWNQEENIIVGKLLMKLLEYWQVQKNLNGQLITLAEKALWDECGLIAERLLKNTPNKIPPQQELELPKRKEHQLNLLFSMFEELAKSSDHQRRGFLLQNLLNQLFLIHEIPVTKSFQRNDGGEQIDGAFSYQGWYYLVECKWTKKLADIRELDSLLGKVNRSGKQAMGLFLSIDGWSDNVPPLLKQNSQKCIVLMEGYDLRCVLSGAIGLERLLNAKLAKLNLETEPYFSAVQIMKENY